MIVVVDYGLGNLGAILNMLRTIGAKAQISSDPTDIAGAEKLILPGVGAFDNGMKNLRERGFFDILNRQVIENRTPILGICLGLQLFTQGSEEGSVPGLGWLDAKTVRFRFDQEEHGNLKRPHMGWNLIDIKKPHFLFDGMHDESRFYFVHSYHLSCRDPSDVLCTTTHGYEFVSGIQSGNVVGLQFHPEKSHRFGLKVLSNFAGSPANA